MEIQVPSLLRIKPRALQKLGKYLRQEGFRKISLFWGGGIQEFFQETMEISFASAEIRVLYEEVVETNDIDNAFASAKKLPPESEVVVALGGGTVIDYCKYVAFLNQVPLLSVPTLISNDAFASPTSSLVVDGRRKTVKSTVPYGVIIDTETIRRAPRKFLYGGIGDLFCKTTAIYDWKLAYKNTGEVVNDFAATVCQNAADTFTFYENKNMDDLEYVRIIASSLLMTGIAMIIAGNSRPASGSEHLVSHAYDRVCDEPSLHGLQVGVASYAVSYLQKDTHERIRQDIISSGFADFMKETPLNRECFLRALFLAPDIKQGFFTILSERGNIEKLHDFVCTDELMNTMLG
ncbi:iron-containing alcohol dehydrogenase family protein [Chitinivibrio alkaliphilus]|uniref:3-dehydroquinate synthase n=1 Tax=Chitinivibrio alkaliphilus ACht1 TaxID=1313304 RepID=U7D9H2_9BACT|nr:iron-containing alcohol dehydrogenase family protein [Chitinivibrio alkaliphilus]ERP31737.1 3-dehydroquinate synthase [Chitinivibrio alkaliphilus ACht1]